MELKRFKDYFVAGSGIILLGIVVLTVFDLAFLGMSIVLSGLMLIFIGIYWAMKTKTELPDERYKRVLEKAGFNAFWTTIGILAVLTYVDFYYPLGLNFREFFMIVVGVGMFSFHVHRFYYNRKGFK